MERSIRKSSAQAPAAPQERQFLLQFGCAGSKLAQLLLILQEQQDCSGGKLGYGGVSLVLNRLHEIRVLCVVWGDSMGTSINDIKCEYVDIHEFQLKDMAVFQSIDCVSRVET